MFLGKSTEVFINQISDFRHERILYLRPVTSSGGDLVHTSIMAPPCFFCTYYSIELLFSTQESLTTPRHRKIFLIKIMRQKSIELNR